MLLSLKNLAHKQGYVSENLYYFFEMENLIEQRVT